MMKKDPLNPAFQLRVGKAIESAAKKLPDNYDIVIEIRQVLGIVRLLAPPVTDKDGGQEICEWEGDIADHINAATRIAIHHHKKHFAKPEQPKADE